MTDDRRRVPQQARSIERVERILKTAEEELANRPVSEIGIADLAKQSGIPAASVYQYFSSKSALFAAVADKMLRDFRMELFDIVRKASPTKWREVLAEILSRSVRKFIHDPAYRHLLQSLAVDEQFRLRVNRSSFEMAEMLAAHPLWLQTSLGPDQVRAACRLLVNTVASTLEMLVLAPDWNEEHALRELDRMLAAYLESYFTMLANRF